MSTILWLIIGNHHGSRCLHKDTNFDLLESIIDLLLHLIREPIRENGFETERESSVTRMTSTYRQSDREENTESSSHLPHFAFVFMRPVYSFSM